MYIFQSAKKSIWNLGFDASLSTMTIWNKKPGIKLIKIDSEYDQEIPQSQTTDKPIAPQGMATRP